MEDYLYTLWDNHSWISEYSWDFSTGTFGGVVFGRIRFPHEQNKKGVAFKLPPNCTPEEAEQTLDHAINWVLNTPGTVAEGAPYHVLEL